MKKLLHSLLLLSLVGSAMATGVSEQEILSLARGSGDVEEILKNIDMEEVQRTAEDLMYDVSSDAAQLLISRIIEELKQKKRFLKTGSDKNEQDPAAIKRSLALDKGLEAMRRDLKKLENGASDPEELETQAAKTALENAAPMAFSNKLAAVLGASAAGVGVYNVYQGYQDFDRLKKAGVSTKESAQTALKARLPQGDGYGKFVKPGLIGLGTAGALGGAAAISRTRKGRQVAAKIYRGLKSGVKWAAAHPGLALGGVGLSTLLLGGSVVAKQTQIGKKTLNSFKKLTRYQTKEVIQSSIRQEFKTEVDLLNGLITEYNKLVSTTAQLEKIDVTQKKDDKGQPVAISDADLDGWKDEVAKVLTALTQKDLKLTDIVGTENSEKQVNLVLALRTRDKIKSICEKFAALYTNSTDLIKAIENSSSTGGGNVSGSGAGKTAKNTSNAEGDTIRNPVKAEGGGSGADKETDKEQDTTSALGKSLTGDTATQGAGQPVS